MVYDDSRFYCVNTDTIFGGPRQAVRAISLEDGSAIWSRALTGPRDTPGDRAEMAWSIALTQRYVIAYPTSSATRR